MTCAECRVELYPFPEECKECHQLKLADYYRVVFCPLHAQAEALREALELIIPLAKGYAHAHPVGSNERYVQQAVEVLATLPPRSPHA